MFTQPSVDDFLEGVTRTLSDVLLPQLGGLPDAQRVISAMLMVLERVTDQWPTVVTDALEDVSDIEETLEAMCTVLSSEPVGPSLTSLVRSLPALPTHPNAHQVAERARALKATLVSTMELVGLPAGPGCGEAVRSADAILLASLQRMTEREAATYPEDFSRMVASKNLRPASSSDDTAPARLARFIDAQLRSEGSSESSGVVVTDFRSLPDGSSRDTYFFDVTHDDPETGDRRQRRCVLQQEAISSVLENDHLEGHLTGTRRRPETEFKVLRAVWAAGFPVPEPLWVDPTGEWLDRPFFITEWVHGTADDSALMAAENSDDRQTVFETFARLLARLHQLDVDECGLAFLSPSALAENVTGEVVDSYVVGYERHRLEVIPAVDYLIRWLRANQPTAKKLSLVHGDFRRGQTLRHGTEITAVLDWEQCHLGDAAEDIAFAYWPVWTPEPVMPIDEFLAIYEDERGSSVDRDALAFYRLFMELKMVIVFLTATKSFFATEARQLHYAAFGPGLTAMPLKRALDELAAGGPTYRYDAARGAARFI